MSSTPAASIRTITCDLSPVVSDDDDDDDDDIVTPLRSNSTKRRLPLFSDDQNSNSQKKTRLEDSNVDNDDGSSTCSFLSKGRSRAAVKKSEEDRIPLPDPFPLPKNYKADVEIALKTTRMTAETRSSFLSAVASSMYSIKKHPTKTDYVMVARTIVQNYPFMKALSPDPPYVSFNFLILFTLSVLYF